VNQRRDYNDPLALKNGGAGEQLGGAKSIRLFRKANGKRMSCWGMICRGGKGGKDRRNRPKT
jgi:hypothetical protein